MQRNTCTINLFFYLVVIGLSPGSATGQDGSERGNEVERLALDKVDRSGWKLSSEKDVLEYALAIIGMDSQTDHAGIEVRLIALRGDNTPFLGKTVAGSQIWHVVVPGWRLGFCPESQHLKRHSSITLDIYVDGTNGHLVKILSRTNDAGDGLLLAPTAASAEKQMSRAAEIYVGFPDELPAVSFRKALEVVAADGVRSPCMTAQILAHYVIRTTAVDAERHVWAVTLRDIAPLPASRRSVSVTARSQLRNIVDAQTGEWLMATTTPQLRSTPNSEKMRDRWPRPAP